MIPISDDAGHRRSAPLINTLIIVATVAVFIGFEQLQPTELALRAFVLSNGVIPLELVTGRDLPPAAPLGIVYTTLLTSLFLHGGWLHLGSNMLYLWIFGDNVEDALGHGRYLLFYLTCGVLANLSHIALNASSAVPSIGASGAIAGVLAAYLVLFPAAKVRTLLVLGPFITVTRVSAIFLLGFWFLMQLVSGIAGLDTRTAEVAGVAFWAHIGGFIAGFILIRFMGRRRTQNLDTPFLDTRGC